MMEAWPGWGVAAVGVGLTGAWTLAARAVARASGWQRIVEVYPGAAGFHGRMLRFQSARVGPTRYPRCLSFGVDATGLHLAPALPLRPGHPRACVPWEDVRAYPEPGAREGPVRLHFEREYETELRISRSLAERVADLSGGRLVVAELGSPAEQASGEVVPPDSDPPP